MEEKTYIKMLAAKSHQILGEFMLSYLRVDFPSKNKKVNKKTLAAHKGASGQVLCRRLLINFSKTTILGNAANMQNVSEFEKSSIRKIGTKIWQMTCPEVPKEALKGKGSSYDTMDDFWTDMKVNRRPKP
ncbi:MAG: hypothetical protein LVR00_02715 [Rhabdochlamydiaceae bacterium]|jgi:hypothetical protein